MTRYLKSKRMNTVSFPLRLVPPEFTRATMTKNRDGVVTWSRGDVGRNAEHGDELWGVSLATRKEDTGVGCVRIAAGKSERMKIINITLITIILIFSVRASGLSPFGLKNSTIQDQLMLFPSDEENVISENFGFVRGKTRTAQNLAEETVTSEMHLPRNVLVLMVEFPDNKFEEAITNRDFLENPEYRVKDFIGRHLFHLQSYYLDASKEKYEINYTVLDTLVLVANPMSFYGEQGRSLVRRVRLVREVISLVDPLVDFSLYDAYMIFHSGAGKETDIYGENPHTIPSSFLNRRLIQAVMDPENDDYPGLLTADGVYIQEIIIAASHQTHRNLSEPTNYSGYGLLCYLFGRQIGLPTLFGNVTQMGRASGTGNFCLMGTGAWNASGYVPPYLSAWTRYFAGWEKAVVIDKDSTDIQLIYPFKPPLNPPFVGEHEKRTPRLYKIPISEDEYYLIENREQNPDGANINGQPRFTFALLPDGEQDYYDKPFDMVPRFNFMKNSYRGCDWDFYLPGYGGPDVDAYINGSGILIWHIDERIIREQLEDNTINANPGHQGVTLIEADGIQHLRSSIPHILMRGSPDDSFRRGHNDYFGRKLRTDGSLSIPFAESYYGNVELEISGISSPGPEMTFSLTFGETIRYQYSGSDAYPPGVVENGLSSEELIFIPTRSGKVFLMNNGLPLPGYPVQTDSIPHLYAFSPDNASFFVPTTEEVVATRSNTKQLISRLVRFSQNGFDVTAIYDNYAWATHPLIITHSADASLNLNRVHVATALHNESEAKVVLYDINLRFLQEIKFPSATIAGNMMYNGSYIYLITQRGNETYLHSINPITLALANSLLLSRLASTVKAAVIAPLTRAAPLEQQRDRFSPASAFRDEILILTDDNALFLFDELGNLCTGFPVYLDSPVLSVPVLADITGNGYLEIVLVTEDGVVAVNYGGEVHKEPAVSLNHNPSDEEEEQKQSEVSLGALALDLNNNGKNEIIATLPQDRISLLQTDLKNAAGYPLVSHKRLLHGPAVSFNGNSVSILFGMADGQIKRRYYPDSNLTSADLHTLWYSDYANLQRTASFSGNLPQNTLATDKIFVKEHCYVFPSPLTHSAGGVLYFNIMVSRNVPVEIKVFDISGKLVFQDRQDCLAYVSNRDKVSLRIDDLSTGVYYVLLKAEESSLMLRFAVER